MVLGYFAISAAQTANATIHDSVDENANAITELGIKSFVSSSFLR